MNTITTVINEHKPKTTQHQFKRNKSQTINAALTMHT